MVRQFTIGFMLRERALPCGKVFIPAGIMGLGWDELGDLNTYASKDEMAQKLRDIHGGDSSYKNSAHAVWQLFMILSLEM